MPVFKHIHHIIPKSVEMIDNNGETLCIFSSVTEAVTATKINNIHLAAIGKLRHAGGYKWRYYNADLLLLR